MKFCVYFVISLNKSLLRAKTQVEKRVNCQTFMPAIERQHRNLDRLLKSRAVTTANAKPAGLKRGIIQPSDSFIVRADPTTLGLKSSCFFTRLEDADILIPGRPLEKQVDQPCRGAAGN